MKRKEKDNLQEFLSHKEKKLSTFSSMGLSKPLLDGIQKLRYQFPTPIQRKMIPSVLSGRDVFCMSKTGSGKSAGFLIPVIERLKEHTTVVGIRCLVISPTRELSMQTDQFARQLACKTDLQIVRLIGGDNLNSQYSAMTKNPDLVIGTPGRILHVLKEAQLSLSQINMIVFDEADQLFEMGLESQMRDILNLCSGVSSSTSSTSGGKQLIFVSATLPRILVGFIQSISKNPLVIRLDESKLSKNLSMSFFLCQSDEKYCYLSYILDHFIKIHKNSQQNDDRTILFCSTKYHVEFIHSYLRIHHHFESSMIYGRMFRDLRKQQLENFKRGKTKLLIVTDVASRGLDLPYLNHVINFNFPSSIKLFLHRVGRVARMGKSGMNYNVIDPEERPYLANVIHFLQQNTKERRKILSSPSIKNWIFQFQQQQQQSNDLLDLAHSSLSSKKSYFGKMNQEWIDFEMESFLRCLKENEDLKNDFDSSLKAEKKYKKSIPSPPFASVQLSKTLFKEIGIHPLVLLNEISSSNSSPLTSSIILKELQDMEEKESFQKELKDLKMKQTVFEFGELKGSDDDRMMKKRRMELDKREKRKQQMLKDQELFLKEQQQQKQQTLLSNNNEDDDEDDDEEEGMITNNFNKRKRKRKGESYKSEVGKFAEFLQKKNEKNENEKNEFFVHYEEGNGFVDQSYSMNQAEHGGKSTGGGSRIDSMDNLQQGGNLDIFSVEGKKEAEGVDVGATQNSTQTKRIWDRKSGKFKRIHLAKGEHYDARMGKITGKKTDTTGGKTYERWRKLTRKRIQEVGEREKQSLRGPTFKELQQMKLDDLDFLDENSRDAILSQNWNTGKKEGEGGRKGWNKKKGEGKQLLTKNELRKVRNEKEKKLEHERRAKMVRKNKGLKQEWHLEAMEKKQNEIEEKRGRFKKKYVGKKRKREEMKGKFRLPKQGRKKRRRINH